MSLSLRHLSYSLLATSALLTSSLAGDSIVSIPETSVIPDADPISPYSLAGLGLVSPNASPFLRDTRLFLKGRLRYEYGDLEGREDSYALTWRHRAGIETGEWLGFTFLAEVEHTWDLLGEDQYNPFPRPGRTVIADPGNIELNRLQLQYQTDLWNTTIIAGRQEIDLGDQRFVGSVAWRQNEQTFDAIRLQTSPIQDLILDYTYLSRVNRIFGEQSPSAALNHFESDSHLINLRYTGLEQGTLTAFAYLLDLEEAPALSSQTYGIRFNGTMPVNESASFIYDLQWATQQDYDANAADYSAQYYRVEGGMDWNKSIQIGIGYEVLGEDDGVAFQTPLGTNHKFNGFADAFLATPATGLQDVYAWVGGVLPGGFKTRLTYHHFLTDTHRHKLGDELDLTIGRKLSDHASALLKAAHLRGNGAQPDISRVSIELDYSF